MNEERIRCVIEDADVGGLLRDAGSRPDLHDAGLEQLRAAAREAWEDGLRSSRRRTVRKVVMRLAIAAAIAVAVLTFVLVRGRERMSLPAAIASVELSKGRVVANDLNGDPVATTPGSLIDGGVVIGTGGDSHLSIRMESGVAIRLDERTRATLLSSRSVRLLEGAIYVDTGQSNGTARRIEVHLADGVARDIGTRFEVRIAEGNGATIVRVRDGRVALESHGLRREAAAGTEIVVESADRVHVRALPGWSEEWGWVLDAAPGFEIEGRTLAEYLDWVTREAGWAVEYETTWARTRAAEIVLHGSIGTAKPAEAPFALLAGSGLSGRLENGVLSVGEVNR